MRTEKLLTSMPHLALPKGWQTIRLGDALTLKYGKSLPVAIRSHGDVPVFGSNGVVGYHSEAVTQNEAIIIGRKGSVGEVHLSEGRCWPIDTTYFVDEFSMLYPRWAYYLLHQLDLRRLDQSTAIPGLNREHVYKLKISFPPFPEQRRIAATLDKLLALVERTRDAGRRQLDDIDVCERASIRKTFRLRPMTCDADIVAPKGWKWHTLTDVARLESGHTPSRRQPEWWGGDVPWLALPDIRALDGQTAIDTIEKTNEAGLANSSARLLPKGTVVLSRTASVGFVAVMGRPMATSQDFVNWVCGPRLLPWYLAYALMASREFLLSLASGAIHKTIYVPTVKALRICLPPLHEQAQIVAQVEAIRSAALKARTSAGVQSELTHKLPGALLRIAFRGEL